MPCTYCNVINIEQNKMQNDSDTFLLCIIVLTKTDMCASTEVWEEMGV